MDSNQGSEIANNGVKKEIKGVPGMKNEKNFAFAVVNESEVHVVGSLDGTKENGNDREEKLEGMNTSGLTCLVDCNKTEEIKGNGLLCVNQGSIDGESENVDELHDREFLVGDLVWGKIKNQPWWPGLIYDPADASHFASMFKSENKLLVGYFGDGSASWCSTSQLVHFVENYEEMSKQIRSRSFIRAVEEALGELGRRVELMICSCVPEENLTDLARPEAMNAAVRPGTLMPNGAMDKLPSPWCEPAELLSYVRNVGQAGTSNFLELVLMKSWLSSFSRVKRGCSLPIYPEPQLIEGLEDKSKNTVLDVNIPIQAPSEERSGSPKTLPVEGLMASSTKKRKQKSVAVLMGEDEGVKLKGKKKSKIAEQTPSTTEKNNNTVSDINGSCIQQASDSQAIVVCNGFQIERVENESNQSIVLKKDEDPIGDIEVDTDDKTIKRSISRERKNSKYLCYPYIVPSPELWRSYSKWGLETKSDRTEKFAKVGDRLTKVAGQLISSPSLTKCNSAVSEEEMSGNSLKLATYVENSQKSSEKTSNCSMDINTSADQVVADFLSSAVDVLSIDRSSIEPLRTFVSAFRSSAFVDTSNYKLFHDQKSSKKRKSSVEQGDIVTDLDNAAEVSAQPASHSLKMDKPRSRVTKLKKSARAAPDALIVAFGSDSSLPSKDEIVKTFSQFGSINEDQTKFLNESNCAQVVFISSANAELAFKESIKQCPFSGNNVKYNMQYSSDASRALGSGKTTSRSPKKRSLTNSICLLPTDGDVSQVDNVRKNLSNLTSTLNQWDGQISEEEKSNLECEIRRMLQKVSELAVKALI